MTLTSLGIAGFKSIESISPPLELRPVTVLIGANGAGKSNFILFFRLLHEMMSRRLQWFVKTQPGRGDSLLYYGSKNTQRIQGALALSSEEGFSGGYKFFLDFSPPDSLIIEHDKISFGREVPGAIPATTSITISRIADETNLPSTEEQAQSEAHGIWDFLRRSAVFHFIDTSRDAAIRKSSYIHDNAVLQRDGGNLASVLFKLKKTHAWAYRRIIATIHQILPWFRDFRLEPLELNPTNVQLDWYEQGSDLLFGPHQLPDGGLRAIALVTALLQPEELLPRIIVMDEPELGLHPHALSILAALVKGAAFHSQIILATQSVALLEHFDPEDIIVVDRENGASTFTRLEPEKLKDWLDDYSLGELWEKNVIGGGPV